MQDKIIRYGGAVTGREEERAIIRSIKKSRKTRQWQAGEEASLFEKELQDYLNIEHAILTTSGSSAGLLALQALELPKGSEVIIPAVTFPTIFNIILQCGLTPVVIDVEIGTYNLDPKKLEEAISDKTKAIIAVHAVGNPCDMYAIMAFANKHHLFVIEDNCDGLGSTLTGKKVGTFGHISFTSFHAAHIVSMGVGGGVFTNLKYLADNVKMYRDWGRQANLTFKFNGGRYPQLPPDQDSRFIYEKIGYNFQILELQAAMGRVQLKKINKIKKARKKNFDYLTKHLSKHKDIILPSYNRLADVCWFSLPLSVKKDRAKLLIHLDSEGIETRSMFSGNILKHPAYKDLDIRSTTLESADWILEHSFWISCHPALTQKDLDRIVKAFDDFYA